MTTNGMEEDEVEDDLETYLEENRESIEQYKKERDEWAKSMKNFDPEFSGIYEYQKEGDLITNIEVEFDKNKTYFVVKMFIPNCVLKFLDEWLLQHMYYKNNIKKDGYQYIEAIDNNFMTRGLLLGLVDKNCSPRSVRTARQEADIFTALDTNWN